MRDQKFLATPFLVGVAALAFLLTVGVQLYMQGDSMTSPESPTAATEASLETQEVATATTTEDIMEASIQELDDSELPERERPVYTVSGRVRSDLGQALDGADVRLFLIQGDQEREVTRVLTDEEGHFEGEVDALASLSTESLLAATLEARIVAKNHMPARRRIDPTQSGSAQSSEITLASGHFVRGRILDDSGAPVEGCSVDLYLNCPPGTPRRETKRNAVTDAHGEYLFGWKRGQGLRFVDAEHSTWGQATIALDTVSATQDQILDDITLDPGGTLAGLVTCKLGGDLLPGVRIDAHPKSSVKRGKRKWTFTGTDGSFHLSGLASGEYELWVEDATRPVGTWRTGTDNIELEVDLVRLVVSVRDPRNNPLPGQRIQFVNIAGASTSALMNTASDTAKGSDAVVVFSPARMSDFGKDRLADGMAVAMRATSITVPTYEELIDIPEGACRIDHTFTLLSSEELGQLQVRVEDSRGQRLEDPVIKLTSLHSGELVTNLFDRDDRPDTWLSTLAPGRYSLEILPRNRMREQNMILDLAPSEPIEVRQGSLSRVDLTARTGGRIRIEINTLESETLDPVDYPKRLARATLAAVGSETPLHDAPAFEVEQRGQIQTELPVRQPLTSFDVLEPGAYQLRVTCPGYETQTRVIQVTRDQITTESIKLRPW